MSSVVTIGSAMKRGRGRKGATVSITGSSDGDNGGVISTNESEEGSSESADGLVVRQSKRVKPESLTSDTSDSIILPSSSLSSSAGALSEGGAVTMTNMQSLLSSLLGPVVTQLQSLSQQQIAQGEQLQSLSGTVSSLNTSNASLSASVSSMKEDVAIILKQVLPLTLVGGGLRTSNVLSVLYGAHGIGQGIFSFLDCKDGNNLRLVCHEMRTAVAAFPWNDKETCIKGSLCSWRTCFPNARAAMLGEDFELHDADFRFFRGLHYLDVAWIQSFSDAALSHLSGLRYLDISHCTQLTDAILPHLADLETLVMRYCPQAGITGTAFEPLRDSIQEIRTEGCSEVVQAAARAVAPRSMAKYLYSTAHVLPSGGSHVLEDGRSMNERQLYLESLRLYPQHAAVFNNLGLLLTSSERLTLPDGRSMNQRELYLEAIRHNPRSAVLYYNLAKNVNPDERICLLDGSLLSQRELYLEAIRLNPGYANAYNGLAITMTAVERVELPDGRQTSERELYLECLRLDPSFAAVFANLACTVVSATERISLPDGRNMNQRELYLEALRIEPEDAFFLNNLADTMTAKEKVTLPDSRVMTKKQLLAFAATLE